MAGGPATYLHQMGSLPGPALQADEDSSSAPEPQSTHKSLKPVKLNLDELLHPASAKKMTQRQLFGAGRNLEKDIQTKTIPRKTLSALQRPGDIQTKAIPRKTLSALPRPGPSIRRTSGTFKAPLPTHRSMVNRTRPSVAPSYTRESQMYRRRTQAPLALTKTRTISGSSGKKEPGGRLQNPGSSISAIPSGQANVGRKVTGHIPRLANLENSVNLLNVDDVEEKLVKEPSLLKSQILQKIHKNTRELPAYEVTNEQKILDEQILTNGKLKLLDEKLKHLDENFKKVLNELTSLKEIINNRYTQCKSCSCQCHATDSTDMKNSDMTKTNTSEQKVLQPTCDEPIPDTEVSDCERKRYSLRRRSSRLANKDAQYAYDSLRKSTKLLRTPRPGSAKTTNTPGRLSRKVIAQLNDLYHD